MSIYELADQNGARVSPSWFGSSWKKDVVCVSTLFGIITRAIRSKNLDDSKVTSSVEFKAIKDMINSIPIDEMAGRSQFPAMFPETPPTSPETDCLQSLEADNPFATAAKLERMTTEPRLKIKQAGAVANNCLDVLQEQSKCCDLGKVFGYGLLYGEQQKQDFVREILSSALNTVAQKQGIRNAFDTLLSDDLNRQYLETLRVPDWVQLYVKLNSKLPNQSWQSLLNFLNIGRSGKSTDLGLLLTTNEIRAQKDIVFSVTRKTFNLEPLADELRGHGISLKMALICQTRQSRLHQGASQPGVLEFNLKLDGRPFAGREQVSVGVVPMMSAAGKSLGNAQSALAVIPIAIANCAEKRSEVAKLITRLNEEKKVLKADGLTVDGKHYTVKFKGCKICNND